MLDKSKTTLAFVFLYFLVVSVLAVHGYNSYKEKVIAEQIAQEIKLMANRSIKSVNTEHLKCLATNIYHEAGGEPFMGQVAVARVVMNRIKHGFAPNPCRVVYQATIVPDLDETAGVKKLCQFSWVCENKPIPSSNNPVYKQAEQIAFKVLSENKWNDIIPTNVLFFHNTNVDPEWKYKRVMSIGNHVFYGKEKHANKQ